MVNVSHHSHDRRTRHPIFFVVVFFIGLNGFHHFGTYIFSLEAKLFGYDINCFRIQTLIDGNHDTDTHTSRNNLCNRNIHHVGEVVGCHEFGQLQYLAFHFFLFHQFVFTLLDGIAFVATVLGTFIIFIPLVGQTGQGFLYLLLYIFLADLRLHRLAQAWLAIVVRTRRTCVGSRRIVHVYAVFLDTVTFFLCIRTTFSRFDRSTGSCRSVFRSLVERPVTRLLPRLVTGELLSLVFTLFLAFLLRLFLRTGRLIQRVQVYLPCYLDFRLELRSIQPE